MSLITQAKIIHLIGIKGVGMTALAELLLVKGKQITGSDTEEKFFTDEVLENIDIRPQEFSQQNISKSINLVIRSSAYGNDNIEVRTAQKLGIPVLLYVDAVAELFNAKRGILITGTHGKTTTTAMIGRVLEEVGLDPTVLVGSKVIEWGRNSRAGKGEWFVAEGDEYQGKFLKMNPEVLVITNIEYDHPDFFKDEEMYRAAFLERARNMPESGLVVAEKSLQNILINIPCRIVWFGVDGDKTGRHRELNEKAALAVLNYLDIAQEFAEDVLKTFQGTARRTEFYTVKDAHMVVIDDYAHHPTEIRFTLKYLRTLYPKRWITAIFQPHTYSRTYALLNDFALAFSDADEVIFLPIYSSTRERKEDFSANIVETLAKKTRDKFKNVQVLSGLAEAVTYCRGLSEIPQERLVITLGAGDAWKICKALAL